MQTARLTIEDLRPEHAPLVFEDLLDERIYTFMLQTPPASVEALEARCRRLVAGLPPERAEVWLNWVLFKTDDRTPIGWIQASVYPDDRRSEVAWIVFPHAWRQGYATEGVRWMLAHLHDAHEVTEAIAEIDTRNAPSIALVERLGFALKGTVPTDEGHDHIYVLELA